MLDIIGKNSKANTHQSLAKIPKPMSAPDGASFSIMLKGNLTKFELVDPKESFNLLVGKPLFGFLLFFRL